MGDFAGVIPGWIRIQSLIVYLTIFEIQTNDVIFLECGDDPSQIAAGTFSLSDGATSREATYSCNPGFGLVGNSIVSCTVVATGWETPPTCEAG